MPETHDIDRQVAHILDGHVRTLARVLTRVEDRRSADIEDLLRQLYAHAGKALTLGVTGSPGAGKSTLVDALISHYRSRGRSVAVIAVDPSSPFSGGALLGDRVRMQKHASDSGVFIRSMATRGRQGGLSAGVQDALVVLDAAGFDILIVETVGVGQDEVEVAQAIQTVVVVMAPGMGDDVQALKAGLMEIGDVFVVNKADRPEAAKTQADLEALLSDPTPPVRETPIVATIATEGKGIPELAEILDARFKSCGSGQASERQVELSRRRLLQLMGEKVNRRIEERVDAEALQRYAVEVLARRRDPYGVVDLLLREAGLEDFEK